MKKSIIVLLVDRNRSSNSNRQKFFSCDNFSRTESFIAGFFHKSLLNYSPEDRKKIVRTCMFECMHSEFATVDSEGVDGGSCIGVACTLCILVQHVMYEYVHADINTHIGIHIYVHLPT